ncbi:hypothetical protein [Paraburkholderia heleia]|uniref:hypothetical protein n=1 Tax=Paraburkholderia heleia TaxID=634127 RepID=UPI000B0EA36B|nr:hypothetical protein [Paraburkholderia heleia]
MTLEAVADAPVDFVLLLQSQRSFAVALADARSGSDDHRKRFREAMRGGVADILSRAIAHLKPARAKIMAIVLIPMLKGVASIANEEPSARAVLMAELRDLVRLYLVSASARANVK